MSTCSCTRIPNGCPPEKSVTHKSCLDVAGCTLPVALGHAQHMTVLSPGLSGSVESLVATATGDKNLVEYTYFSRYGCICGMCVHATVHHPCIHILDNLILQGGVFACA